MATETYTTSWFSRLGNSIKGILVGIILFIAGIVLLFWNEGRAVKTATSLNEAQEQCVEITTDKIDPANEGKVVHAVGKAETQEVLEDELFSIKKNAISLEREVEYYQWVEHREEKTKKKLGGGEETVVTYTYSKEWVDSPVDSAEFHPEERSKHTNTVCFSAADDATLYADQVTFGAYMLNKGQIHKIHGDKPLNPATEITVPQELRGRVTTANNYVYISTADNTGTPQEANVVHSDNQIRYLLVEGAEKPILCREVVINDTSYAKLEDGTLACITAKGEELSIAMGSTQHRVRRCKLVYIDGAPYLQMPDGNMTPMPQDATPVETQQPTTHLTGSANPDAPKIGDVRICWTYIEPTADISIIAVQTQNTFSPFVSPSNGYKVDILTMGHQNAATMFADSHSGNNVMTWILRVVGWFCMFIGASMVLKPLSVIADVVPFIGNIIEFGTTIIALLVATIVAFVIIAIAWLFYRPLIAIPLLIAAVGLVVYIVKKRKTKQEAPTATPPAA